MEYKQTRLFLLLAIAMVGLFLYSQWTKESREQVAPLVSPLENKGVGATIGAANLDIPMLENKNTLSDLNVVSSIPEDRLVSVETDLFKIKIDTMGGDIIYAELKDYPESTQDKQKGFVLLSTDALRNYIAQTGLISTIGPDSPESRGGYRAEKMHYKSTGNEPLIINLHWEKNLYKIYCNKF